MKKRHAWILYIALGIGRIFGAEETLHSIVERGPHHRVRVNVTSAIDAEGKTVSRTNRYTELGNGICYQNQNGEWIDSKEVIDIVAGGALASQGAHQVGFAANINTRGAINMLTPDGKRLRSHVLGLAYTDTQTGKSIMIAEVRDSIGELVGQNQVIYRDAFAEFRADIRFTYRLAGLEQDIILRDNPPSPEAYGFRPATTRLEVFTEFIEAPLPEIVPATLSGIADPVQRATLLLPDFVDQTLKFGAMEIGPGQSFPLSDEGALPEKTVPTGKTWEQKDGRTFLIEAVEYPAIKPHLDVLAAKAAANQEAKAHPVRTFPRSPAQAKNNEEMKMASIRSKENGFVIDYIVTSGVTNFTFKADTTYLVNNNVFYLWGTTVIEGGTVIKYTNGFPQLRFCNAIDCRTSPYRPAVATSMHDDTVGDTISGSTGNPTNYCGIMFYLGNAPDNYFNLHDIRVSHAWRAFHGTTRVSADISNCQVRHTTGAFNNHTAFWSLRNILVLDAENGFGGVAPHTNTAEHITFHTVSNLVTSGLSAVRLTNSILICVTNGVSWSGGTDVQTNLSGTGVFQTVGSGEHYLATNSPYRDVGTTNINPSLLAGLRQLTTHPPQVWTGIVSTATTLSQTAMRDTDILDLGYHYYPIDWLAGSVFVSAPVTLTNGAVLAIGNATVGSAHIQLNGGAQFIASGSPLTLARITQPTTVQEKGTLLDSHLLFSEGTNITSATVPIMRFRFADLTMVRAGQYYLYAQSLASIELTHSQVRGGYIQYGGNNTNAWTKTFAVTNSLFERTGMWLGGNDTWFRLHMHNALAYGGSVSFSPTNASTVWTVKNSSFDGATLWQYAAFTNHNNAYVLPTTNLLSASNSLTLSNCTYDTGPLGFYYHRTNSLANKGTNTADTWGLYHFTCTTNQVKETNSIVDIGFHYVALDASGNPWDYDGDGDPDYYEDRNGNGSYDAGGGETDWTTYNSPNGLLTSPSLKVFTPLK